MVVAVTSENDTAIDSPLEADTPLTPTGRDGQFKFTVQSVERPAPPADEFWSEDAQGEWVAITLSVTNIGDEGRELNSDSQMLYDTYGREFTPAGGIGEWEYQTINPGNSTEVTLYYDVPGDAKLDRMKLHDDWLSSGVEVGLP